MINIIIKIKKILVIFLCLFSNTLYANSSLYSLYLGLDLTGSRLQFKPDYGDKIFSKKIDPGINFSFGYLLNDYLGVEGGIEITKKLRKITTIAPNQIMLGKIVPNNVNYLLYNSFTKQYNPYLGILINLPATKKINLSFLIGLARSKVTAKYHLLQQKIAGVVTDKNDLATITKQKFITFLKTSIKYNVTDNLGANFFVGWKNTAKFKTIHSKGLDDQRKAMLKDTANWGVGIFYCFN